MVQHMVIMAYNKTTYANMVRWHIEYNVVEGFSRTLGSRTVIA